MKKITYDDLYDLYVVQQLSQRDIANQYGCGQTTVRRYMNIFHIPARDHKEAKATKPSKEKQMQLGKYYAVLYKQERYNTCEYCGQRFSVTSDTKHNKYCSSECRKMAIKSQHQYYCIECGALIAFQTSRVYPRKYCDDCVKKRVWNKMDLIKCDCEFCGKTIYLPHHIAIDGQCHYCSTACMSQAFVGRFTGENSPTWKGGKTHHYSGNFHHARKIARERDAFCCQLCGITEDEYGKELSVHHIKSYRSFPDKAEANKLDNLISLCEPCHRFIHSKKNISGLFIDQ